MCVEKNGIEIGSRWRCGRNEKRNKSGGSVKGRRKKKGRAERYCSLGK